MGRGTPPASLERQVLHSNPDIDIDPDCVEGQSPKVAHPRPTLASPSVRADINPEAAATTPTKTIDAAAKNATPPMGKPTIRDYASVLASLSKQHFSSLRPGEGSPLGCGRESSGTLAGAMAEPRARGGRVATTREEGGGGVGGGGGRSVNLASATATKQAVAAAAAALRSLHPLPASSALPAEEPPCVPMWLEPSEREASQFAVASAALHRRIQRGESQQLKMSSDPAAVSLTASGGLPAVPQSRPSRR